MFKRFGRYCQPAAAMSAAATAQMRFLNIHEYQSKALLRDAGVKVEYGIPVSTIEEAEAAIAKIKTDKKVVKSQILAGGRGKGTFVDGYQGGVHVCDTPAEALEAAKKMLGNTLVTKQTGPHGQKVAKLYITDAVPGIKRELYLALVLDRKLDSPAFIGCAQGGTSIEELAKTNPEMIKKLRISVQDGLSRSASLAFAEELGFTGASAEKAADTIMALYTLGKSKDCTQVEINPMVELENGDVMCIDAKLTFDDNAEFRHPDIFSLRDDTQMDYKEVLAKKYDLNYIALDGSVGCMVNGAGLAMATMDLISLHGEKPANFLDVGGSAEDENIVEAFGIIMGDKNVKSILVNIFGGIMKCDLIANGIVKAVQVHGQAKVPIVVRLHGTNEEEGKKILTESGLHIFPANQFEDAAKLACELAAKSA